MLDTFLKSIQKKKKHHRLQHSMSLQSSFYVYLYVMYITVDVLKAHYS